MDFFEFWSPGEISQNIKELIHCPFCGSDYSDENIKVVGKNEKGYMIHLLCGDCSNSIMANLSHRGGSKNIKKDVFEKKIMDAELKEMVMFLDKGGIDDDHVMDFYQTIKDFDGDFKKVFSGKQ